MVRICVWFNPPRAPIIALIILKNNNNIEFDLKENNSKETGAIFWVVDRRRQVVQGRETIILGYQKCKGASPAFKARAIGKRNVNGGPIVVWAANILSKIPPDPSAWVKKYLIAASFSWFELEKIIIGIKEYKLSSSPIQSIRQLLAESVIKSPNRRVNEKNIDEGAKKFIIKSRKESNLTEARLETLSLYLEGLIYSVQSSDPSFHSWIKPMIKINRKRIEVVIRSLEE